MVVLLNFSPPSKRAAPVAKRSLFEGATTPARGAPLRCLAGADFAGRFHKWRAPSGRSYIFSVFPVRRDAAALRRGLSELGGLPEFESAVAFGVVIDANCERRRVGAFELRWRDGRFCGDALALARTLAAGAVEWHIHLLARGPEARRAMLADFRSGA